jgi:uncharacterized protein YgiM (DUF1202 family)
MLSTSLLAQQATDAPAGANPAPGAQPAAVAPAASPTTPSESPTASTNAPAKKTAVKKKAQKKPAPKKQPAVAATELRTVPLNPGPATVVATHVNVRGQPKLNSEVVTRLDRDQIVTVLEEIVRNDSGPEEPSAWAKIQIPEGTHVWVHTDYVDTAAKTVKPRKLNLRSGPGENYSVVGLLVQGETINPVGNKGDWLEIEAPTNAYAFMAAQYLKQETTPSPAATPAEPPPATPATVAEAPSMAAPPTDAPATPPPSTPSTDTNAAAPPTATAAPSEPSAADTAAEEPPKKRIVQREGVVRGTRSIQAPTPFELYNTETGRTIDWLFTPSKELDLRRYKGLRIIVTGEEGLEERWGNTPIITIERIQVLE